MLEAKDVLRKWMPVTDNISSKSNVHNKCFKEYLCFFCEYYSNKYPMETFGEDDPNSLPNKIHTIITKLKNLPQKEVSKTLYNPITGEITYHFTDDTSVTTDTKNDYQLTLDEVVDVFGGEFLSDHKPDEYREYRLKHLLD